MPGISTSDRSSDLRALQQELALVVSRLEGANRPGCDRIAAALRYLRQAVDIVETELLNSLTTDQ